MLEMILEVVFEGILEFKTDALSSGFWSLWKGIQEIFSR
jgi:hypothetical protein